MNGLELSSQTTGLCPCMASICDCWTGLEEQQPCLCPEQATRKSPPRSPPEPCVPLVLLLLLQEGQLGCRPTRAADGCKGCKVGDGCKQMGVISSSLIDEEMEKVESA